MPAKRLKRADTNLSQGHREAIRHAYERCGAPQYYRRHGGEYRNPHEAVIGRALQEAMARWRLDLAQVLDLACGSGEITLALRPVAGTLQGMDPYTGAAYLARTGQRAEGWSFEQIAAGALEGRRYTLIVCSFALHLPERSRLPLLCRQLSRVAPALLVLTPHKRPELAPAWGWTLRDEFVLERVRTRLYDRTADSAACTDDADGEA
jgi:2-polyprenyl-3-methyl-5-hydroxy-6-metoxy-1,4-benzoquinol methylase